MAAACNFMDLPLDVHVLIFKKLLDIKDKTNLAEAHPFLGKAFALQSGNTFKNINLGEHPIKVWSRVLKFCGQSVSRILSREVDEIVTVTAIASKYCPNLEEFFIFVSSYLWEHISPLLLTMTNLTWVGITNNFESLNIIDTMLKLPKLNTLQLSGFKSDDLKRLNELVNLKWLTICNEKNDPVDIYKVCSSMKEIESLEINCGVVRVPGDLGGDQLWPKIDLLRIGYTIFHTELPYLPSLKFLTIDNPHIGTTIDKMFGNSVTKYADTLESLRFSVQTLRTINSKEAQAISKLKALNRLDCQLPCDSYIDALRDLGELKTLILQNCNNITNAGVIKLLYNNRKLRNLDVFNSHQINCNLIMPAVATLHFCGVQPDNPFVLTVSPSFGPVNNDLLGNVLVVKTHDSFAFYDFIHVLLKPTTRNYTIQHVSD